MENLVCGNNSLRKLVHHIEKRVNEQESLIDLLNKSELINSIGSAKTQPNAEPSASNRGTLFSEIVKNTSTDEPIVDASTTRGQITSFAKRQMVLDLTREIAEINYLYRAK
ncbi:hypothetical protein JTB14_023473 [Gonioctena quinquepunctata]|nr:hypothetical protein JTB14_023473 [Gonioctena quinquepunctata]